MTKKLIALMLILTTLLCTIALPASAGNTCNSISGNARKSVTFTIKTDGKALTFNSVKLTQTKGSAKGTKLIPVNKTTTKDMYMFYEVYVYDAKGKQVQYHKWTGASLTLWNLKGNTSYKVIVRPCSVYQLTALLGNFSFDAWIRTPTWTVKKTSGITLCR